jgi:ubiquinol-cytochrome c reductase iron-sulfur subunit
MACFKARFPVDYCGGAGESTIIDGFAGGRVSMATDENVDRRKRRLLLGATTAVGTVGVVATAVPFAMSFWPSARAKAAGAPVEVDISKLEPGQQITVEWRSKPIWVIHRTKEMLANLPKLNDRVADPDSTVDHQPLSCKNEDRSIKPEILVAIGICTHLGCIPTFRPEVAPGDLGPDWLGGFFCPCHQSKFDLAGRVYKGVPAPTNLYIPPYRFLSDTTILVGEESKPA